MHQTKEESDEMKSIALLLLLCFAAICLADEPAKEREKHASFKMEHGKLVLPSPIVFETGSAEIKGESDDALWTIVDFLEAKKDITLVRIEGHTDNDGDADANQKLSEARALAVAKWVVSKGIDCKRVLPVGFGATKPVAANDTPEGKAQNRRIEVYMAALRGRNIGGMPPDGGGVVAGDACK
jgi:OOP family OmpA-OmpF porin